MKRFLPWMLILLTPLLVSMGKKEDFTISFHSQGAENDMPKTIFPMVLDGRSLLFKTLPEITHNNISAFHSFPSATGDYGVTLQLDFRGANNLELLTRTKHGEYLLALINGKPVDYVVMDQVVSNGMITIWQGVPENIVKALEKKYPHITSKSPPSTTDRLDMSPTTPAEKKSFFKRFKKEEREKAKRDKDGIEEEPEVPSFNLPTSPDPNLNQTPTNSGPYPQLPAPPVSSSSATSSSANPAPQLSIPSEVPEPVLPR